MDVRGDVRRIEQEPSGHLLDALGAGTGEPERPGRDQADVARSIPVHQQAVLAAGDGPRERYLSRLSHKHLNPVRESS
jgi:hypothetical protein